MRVSRITVAGFLLWGLQPIMAVRVTHQLSSVSLMTAMQGPMAASHCCRCATAGDQTRLASRLIDQAAAALTLEPRLQAAWQSQARTPGVLSAPAAVQSSNIAEAPAMAGTAANSTSLHNSSAALDSMLASDTDVLGAGATRDSGGNLGSQQTIREQHQQQMRCTAAAQGSHLSRSLVGKYVAPAMLACQGQYCKLQCCLVLTL